MVLDLLITNPKLDFLLITAGRHSARSLPAAEVRRKTISTHLQHAQFCIFYRCPRRQILVDPLWMPIANFDVFLVTLDKSYLISFTWLKCEEEIPNRHCCCCLQSRSRRLCCCAQHSDLKTQLSSSYASNQRRFGVLWFGAGRRCPPPPVGGV